MIHHALRLIRVFHDLKQAVLAKRLGISASYLSEIESGTKDPTMELLKKYSAEFKISLSTIMLFSERLEKEGAKPQAMRAFVAEKVLAAMNWIAEPASDVRGHVRR